jgi:FkbM family methyltransferase
MNFNINKVEDIFTLYEKNYAKEEMPIDQFVSKLKGKKILLFGAGSAGIGFLFVLRKYGIEPLAFLDNDTVKQGEYLAGLPIESPSAYNQSLHREALVIICINTDGKKFNDNWKNELRNSGPDSLVSTLRQYGYEHIIYYSEFWRCYELFRGEEWLLISCSDVPAILQNRSALSEAYACFEEYLSKETFLRYLSFRLLSRDINIPSSPIEKKYFGHSFLQLSEKECFVDGGAYNGNTLTRFLERTSGNFLAYYGFEPDPDLFKGLARVKHNMNKILQDKLKIYQNALYDETKSLRFFAMNGPGSFVHQNGPCVVQGITLNDVDFTYPPTYIKLNVEGCAIEVISGGAGGVIEAYHPSISVRLEKIHEFWEVPLLLKRINSGYRFYLRSYMGCHDLHLFAINQ